MAEERFIEKQRVRANISTTAKGKAQFDITAEIVDTEPEALEKLLKESLAIAMKIAKDAGFEKAE